MTRNEIQNLLRQLGCKHLTNDGKTLVVYHMIQNWLKSNNTPMKAITKIYVEYNEIYVCLYEDNYFNTGFIIE